MAEPRTKSLDDWIAKWVGNVYGSDGYIGVFLDEEDKMYKWDSDGSPVEFSNWKSTSWAKNHRGNCVYKEYGTGVSNFFIAFTFFFILYLGP